MIIRLLFIACLTTHHLSSVSSAGVTLECIYNEQQTIWAIIITQFVTCELQNDLAVDSVAIEAIGETTLLNTDVEIFVAKTRKVPLIPPGLLDVFSNLVGIQIDDSNLSLLDETVIKDLVPLKYFAVTNSKLSVILKGSFTANVNLELIDLTGNSLSFIDAAAFDGPTALAYLYLDGAVCLFGETDVTAETPAALTALNVLIGTKCGNVEDLQALLKSTLKSDAAGKEATENCNNNENPTGCTECETDLSDLKERYNGKLDEIEGYKDDIEAMNAEILTLQNQIKELENQEQCPVATDGSCGFKVNRDYGYSCIANGINIKSAEDQDVFWNGTHASGSDNSKVLSVIIQSQVVELLPLNISATFANLENLVITNCKLTKIKTGELTTLTKLIKLEITQNSIATIDSAAFKLNLLRTLDLSSNKITSLPSKVFNGLPVLEKLILKDNLLTQVRYDWIVSGNNIQEFYLNNNTIAKPIDKTFMWRLQKALIIDLSATGCIFSRNKVADPTQLFMDFYRNVVTSC